MSSGLFRSIGSTRLEQGRRADRHRYRQRRHSCEHSFCLVCEACLATLAHITLVFSTVFTIPTFKDIRKRLSKSSHVNGTKEASEPRQYDPPLGSPPNGDHGRESPPEWPCVGYNGRSYTEDQLRHLVDEIKDYQLTHGSLVKVVEYETESSVPARPIGTSILPTLFPRARYEEAIELQQAYCELYMRVASDPEWLFGVLEPLRNHDPFFTVLEKVYDRVKAAGAVQNVVCEVLRNDYMIHRPAGIQESELKQVEMNTFSCAGAAHAERIVSMHHHLARVRDFGSDATPTSTSLPRNDNVNSIVTMLRTAHSIYASTNPSPRQKCILITVQPFNFNVADERPIELALWDAEIPCYRVEWSTLMARTTFAPDRTLFFSPPFGDHELEVSVIYYRGGYVIEEYNPEGFDLRVQLETSRAIKCPDILTHLSGFKTVQAALAEPGAVERFLPAEKAEKIRRTFMPMQVLDASPAGLAARRDATDPQRCINYVLKPNRDGGGHNIYRSDIPAFLNKMPETEWCQYILMKLIEPPATEGTLMAPDSLYHGAVISELGVLGTCIWERIGSGIEVKMKEVAGWTFKTKPVSVDEMSVVKGYGCFDCPLLVD